jgi:hypothetical protein
MISVEGFRAAFPAFADVDDYPDARVQFWLNIAQKLLSAARWGSIFEEGAYLFVAHRLTLEGAASETYAGGGSSGGGGAVTSESQSIGDTSYSVTYDAAAYTGAGQMASTKYGQQFLDLVQLVGAGGMQL